MSTVQSSRTSTLEIGRGRAADRIRRTERFGAELADPDASVVVVTHDALPDEELARTVRALGRQTVTDFELLLVDNGSGRDLETVLDGTDLSGEYVELTRNYGVNVGRNLAAERAVAPLLVFLDHDGIPAPDFLEAHLRAHEDRDVVAVRGRVRPLTRSVYNRLATNYDLGDFTFPYLLDIEGNTSIRRDVYRQVGGFREGLWGHEGIELTRRLLEVADREAIRYVPGPVIYHDFAVSFTEVLETKARHNQASEALKAREPELFDLYSDYSVPEGSRPRNRPLDATVYLLNKLTDRLGSALQNRYAPQEPDPTT